MRQINQAGIELIKSFEGCRLQAYKDVAGIETVGYGHCGVDVHEGMEINQAAADALLVKDLERFETGVSNLVKAQINDNQFSAIVAFAFNIGLENLKQSTLLRCLNLGHPDHAAEEFIRWNKAGGNVVAGLTRRREAEKALFLS